MVQVVKNKEEEVAEDLTDAIKELTPIDEGFEYLREERYFSAWIPQKRATFVTDKQFTTYPTTEFYRFSRCLGIKRVRGG